jgi:thiol-disulfide isomerase/thioredoxin
MNMANPLTGEFELAAEVSLPAVNRVLAVQHQGQVYLHSFKAGLPPFDDVPIQSGVRGSVQLQVSTPGVSLPLQPGNDGSRVSVHYRAMVRYTNTGTTPVAIPEFVHGEIVATLTVEQTRVGDGGVFNPDSATDRIEQTAATAENVEPAGLVDHPLGQTIAQGGDLINIDFVNNVELKFIPAPGTSLSPETVSVIEQVVLNFLKKGFDPVNVLVRLPSNEDFTIHFWRFKFIAVPAKSAIALLFKLKNVAPSPGSVSSFNALFIESQDDFAIAISNEFIVETITGMISATLEQLDGRQFSGCVWALFGDICATYTMKIRSSKIMLGNEAITFTLTGDLTSPSWYAPNFSFKLELDFGLQIKNNRLGLISVGDVRLSLSSSSSNPFKGVILGAVRDEAKDQIEAARDQILEQTRDQIGSMLSGFTSILSELRIPNVQMTFTRADIRTSGVVVHGKLELASLSPAKIAFNTVARKRIDVDPPEYELVLNAFDSWIPGGTVQQYHWSGLVNQTEDHQFLTRAALPLNRQPKITCLTVRGTQGSFFSTSEVSVQVCCTAGPLVLNPLFTRTNVRNFRFPAPVLIRSSPGKPVAHIDLRLLRDGEAAPSPNGKGNNFVLHFAGAQTDSLAVLGDALTENSDKSGVTFAAAVVPETDLENALSQVSGRNVTLAVDPEGCWSQTFGVGETPATFIIDPKGNVVWQRTGPLDRDALSAAFRSHLSGQGEPVRWEQLRLRLKEGDDFPDLVIKRPRGGSIPLRRLFGSPMLVNFWTSWSAPCLELLQQLQILQNRSTGLIILTVNDGEDPQAASKFFVRHNLTLNLVPDPDRRLSKLCGVNCWPTTVMLANEFGRVQQIHYGLPPAPHGDSLPFQVL